MTIKTFSKHSRSSIHFRICSKFLIILLFAVCSGITVKAQLIRDTAQLAHIDASLTKQKILAKYRFEACFGIFKTRMTADERQAMEFLYAYMPLSDLADYNASFFLKNARISLRAKNEMPWGKDIPEDLFIHFILPVRVNNENLDSFRMVVYEELKKRVEGMDMEAAALEVNHWCHEKVTYKASDERTSSPLQSMCTSFGRCGEESTFTVAAMRTVGIPARQVYTPRWAHCDDNHAWVEVWIDGQWHFLGACEPDAQLDRGWFAGPAKRAMLVHTRVYGWYSGNEPVISRHEKFTELNLISNYAPVKTFTVKVSDMNNTAADSTKVEYQLYNYAEFYPLAKTYTNAAGYTSMTTGLGDLLIWANKGNAWGYKKITVESTDTIVIQLSTGNRSGITEEFDLIPPVERALATLSDDGRKENDKRLRYEDSVRSLYMKTFMDTVSAKAFADSIGLNRDSTVTIMIKSYGNWKAIKTFISSTAPGLRGQALQMLYCLTDKDIRDVPSAVLSDHFNHGMRFPMTEKSNESSFFMKYVVSGRISNEQLTAWKQTLQASFGADFIENARRDVTPIIDFIKSNIVTDALSNAHSRAPLTPTGVLSLHVADAHSRDIFFVALCRSFGIPARLSQETSLPQYYKAGEWHSVLFETQEKSATATGFIHFTNPDAHTDPQYYQDFTIAQFKDGVFRSLNYDELKPLSGFPEKNEVDAGSYLMVTGNRQSDGSVLGRVSFFSVTTGAVTDVPVTVRKKKTEEKSLGKLSLKKLSVQNYTDNEVWKLNKLAQNKGLIVAFIEPDKEPSKHVMADIAAVRDGFEKWGGCILFALSHDKTTGAFSPTLYNGLPSQSKFAWDTDKNVFTEVGKIMGRSDANDLPVVILLDKQGNVFYYSHGYRIGIGEQLLKKLQHSN